MAFDAGLFSFRDVDLYSHYPHSDSKSKIFTLITNPKSIQSKSLNRREPYSRIRQSTHIRVLVFSEHKIKSVQVYIDNVLLGNANQLRDDSNLYTLEWTPLDYLTGVHKIKVIAQDIMDNKDLHEHEFTLITNYVKSFGLLSGFVLLNDQVKIVNLNSLKY